MCCEPCNSRPDGFAEPTHSASRRGERFRELFRTSASTDQVRTPNFDIRRSASGTPPVWQVGQYCNAESEKLTSRIVSPHTGQASPVRRCTRSPVFFSSLSVAARCPTERSTASVSTLRIAACSVSTSSCVKLDASLNGENLAVCRISSLYALPMPAIAVWSVSRPLICLRRSASNSASAATSSAGSSASGPSRAMPGTSIRSGTTYTASRFCVPASVRSQPQPPSRCTCSASGPRPGFAGAAGISSRHCNQPPRDRWQARYIWSSLTARNLPRRSAPRTVVPVSEEIGGSKVLSAENAATSTRWTASPLARSVRNAASAVTSGSSGTRPVCAPRATRSTRRGTTTAETIKAETIKAATIRNAHQMIARTMNRIPEPKQQTLDLGETALAYDEAGQGRPVVYAHGLSSSRVNEPMYTLNDWSPIVASGRRLIRYDARGHGESTGRPVFTDYIWSHLAGDLLAVLDRVAGPDPVDAMGASMGCGTLLYAALERPERFGRLVLLIPPTAWDTRVQLAEANRAIADVVESRGLEFFLEVTKDVPPPPVHAESPTPLPPPSICERLYPHIMRGSAASDLPDPEILRT